MSLSKSADGRRLAIICKQFADARKSKHEHLRFGVKGLASGKPDMNVWYVLLHAIRGDRDEFCDDDGSACGEYIMRITVGVEFPFKPPHIAIMTPNGIFNAGTDICTSISAYHPETARAVLAIPEYCAQALSMFILWPTLGGGISIIANKDTDPESIRAYAKASREFNAKYLAAELADINADTADAAVPAGEPVETIKELPRAPVVTPAAPARAKGKRRNGPAQIAAEVAAADTPVCAPKLGTVSIPDEYAHKGDPVVVFNTQPNSPAPADAIEEVADQPLISPEELAAEPQIAGPQAIEFDDYPVEIRETISGLEEAVRDCAHDHIGMVAIIADKLVNAAARTGADNDACLDAKRIMDEFATLLRGTHTATRVTTKKPAANVKKPVANTKKPVANAKKTAAPVKKTPAKKVAPVSDEIAAVDDADAPVGEEVAVVDTPPADADDEIAVEDEVVNTPSTPAKKVAVKKQGARKVVAKKPAPVEVPEDAPVDAPADEDVPEPAVVAAPVAKPRTVKTPVRRVVKKV